LQNQSNRYSGAFDNGFAIKNGGIANNEIFFILFLCFVLVVLYHKTPGNN